MSFREKNAWIASITTLVVWGYYFFEVWRAFELRSIDGLLVRFWICMGITVVLMLALNLLATRNPGRDFGAAPDEFERQIDESATLIGHRLRGWLLLGLAYGFYAVFALLSLFFVLKFVRETKGRTLEDMDAVNA